MHNFSLRDVQALGVNLLGHQRKIVNAAKQLRTHLTQGHVEVWCFPNCVDTAVHVGRSSPQPVAAHKNNGIEMRMIKKPWVKKKIFIMNYLPICPTIPCWTVVFHILLSLTPSFSVALPLTFLVFSVHYLLAWTCMPWTVWTWALRTQKESSFTISCKDNQRLEMDGDWLLCLCWHVWSRALDVLFLTTQPNNTHIDQLTEPP